MTDLCRPMETNTQPCSQQSASCWSHDHWYGYHISPAYGSRETVHSTAPQSLERIEYSAANPSKPQYSSYLIRQTPVGDTTKESQSCRIAKDCKNFPHNAQAILAQQFTQRLADPYLTRQESEELAALTDLSVRQVQVYFANARARKLCRGQAKASAGTKSVKKLGKDSDLCSPHSNLDPIQNYRPPKKRRLKKSQRIQPDLTASLLRTPSSPDHIFQCTFCVQDFKRRYDWERHEQTIHLRLQQWICMPEQAVTSSSIAKKTQCVFGGMNSPTSLHLQSHDLCQCIKKEESRRTFTRKDKFIKHIENCHKIFNPNEDILSRFSKPQIEPSYWCGICGYLLNSWKHRVTHISEHFKRGEDMRFWMAVPGAVHTLTLSSLIGKAQRRGEPGFH
ncbi:hypothetical protein EJ05DRAFT_542512 [Pseudovirgaria hyperparasitica]|uniref:Homeobox domain-containing protein n=1 Tax=Pseudovirgaria hyperparasitica TaxID=470096 RepID=A0A6A6VTR7_9PEZI|nr:uncharacterized protein EJ05DRAFT_542512 [Pseudovirgaria hyperparasitica]KAF2752637.1 hypothetical protein EJ05DRAFT_542512 [Pseudovirgaria hyperparasitica]